MTLFNLMKFYIHVYICEEKFEDTNVVIRSRESKGR